jgi:cell division protein FtsA
METLTAAIQFGSSHISAAVAQIDKKGRHTVMAVESVPTAGCIRHGWVVNADEAAVHIKNLARKLNNRIKEHGNVNLSSAYVGICGISMHSMEYCPSALLGNELFVPEKTIQQMEDQSRHLSIPGYDIIDLYNNGEEVSGQQVIGHHQLILAKSRLRQGIQSVMEKAGLKIAGWHVLPLVQNDILTEDERSGGTLLVDMGAQLTTMSIWKEGKLRFLTVIPLGGNAVTRDIASKGLRVEEAENQKIMWSDASRPADKNTASPSSIPPKELNVIVAARYEEIIANIAHQLEQSGYKGQLPGGCVLTGGCSVQKGLHDLFEKRLEISPISTRSCSSLCYNSSDNDPSMSSLMTMLDHCTDSCFEEEKAVQPSNVETDKSNETGKKEKKGTMLFKGAARTIFDDLFHVSGDEN